MRTVEVIRVTSSSDLREFVNSRYLDRIKTSPLSPGLEMVRLFFPASHNTECMLVLSWLDSAPQFERSKLADLLLRELKRLGLANHSIWIERYRIQEKRDMAEVSENQGTSEATHELEYRDRKESAM